MEKPTREHRYTKPVAVSPENHAWLGEIKGKKTRAGKLDEIIAFYKESKNL